jgi:hypothetical protein
VVLGIDGRTWLLESVEIRSMSDSTFSYRETYEDYVKTDDIWFPSRFLGFYKGRKYYEFMITVVELGAGLEEDFFTLTQSDTTLSLP